MRKKYDIITFGSATLDVFLETNDFLIRKEKKSISREMICFPFASKVDLKGMSFLTGGGGTNTAAGFSTQGFKTAFCGTIGNDFAGQEVFKDLKRVGVATELLFKTDKAMTNLSVIFSKDMDRICFVWRDASEFLKWDKRLISSLNTDWFYLAPLSGHLADNFERLVNLAQKRKIHVFANLGNSQINLGIKKLKPVLEKIDILLLNQEEASLLTKIPYNNETGILKKLSKLVPGIIVITKGVQGAIVFNDGNLWSSKALSVKVVEKTGAGDAFGSGFLSGLIRENDIEFAFQLAMANAMSCIQKKGAKQGLLKKGETYRKVKIKKVKI